MLRNRSAVALLAPETLVVGVKDSWGAVAQEVMDDANFIHAAGVLKGRGKKANLATSAPVLIATGCEVSERGDAGWYAISIHTVLTELAGRNQPFGRAVALAH
jgi:hypothetical protein